MTSENHPSGTDRIFEAAEKILDASENHLIINLQGDEPLIPPDVINQLIDMMNANQTYEMGTIAVKTPREEFADDPNKVKVVKSFTTGDALYFTRAPAPFLRSGGEECGMLMHWGIYAYRFFTLKKLVSLPESPLEKCEKLEQLRALEAGIKIKILETDERSYGIDVPEDLEFVRNLLNNQKKTGNVTEKSV
jgi:3-deoxy-manno-octulosonate cytidylyltransferase (CMP-KDO synthetase)